MANAYSFKGDLPRHLRGLSPAQASLWESYRERFSALGSPPPVAAVKAWGQFKRIFERTRDGSWQMKDSHKAKFNPTELVLTEVTKSLTSTDQDPHRGAAICESATYPDSNTQVGSAGGGVSSARLSLRPPSYTPDQLGKVYSRILAGMPGVYLKLSEASSEIQYASVVRTLNRLVMSGSTRALLDKVETVALMREAADALDLLKKPERATPLRELAEDVLKLAPHLMVIPPQVSDRMISEANSIYEMLLSELAITRIESFGDRTLDLQRQASGELMEDALLEFNPNHGPDGRFTTSDGASDYKSELMKAHTSLRTYKDPEKRARERTHSKREQKLFKRLWNTPEGTKEFKKAEKQWYRHIGQKNEAVSRFRALLAENSGSRSCTLFHECNGSTACAPCMAKESRGSSCEDDDEDDDKKKYESASTCPECGAPMKDGTCTKCGYSSKTESILEKWNTVKATKDLGAKLLAHGKRALKGDTGVNPIRKTLPPASMSSV